MPKEELSLWWKKCAFYTCVPQGIPALLEKNPRKVVTYSTKSMTSSKLVYHVIPIPYK